MSNFHASKQHGVRLLPRMRPHKSTALKAAKARARARKAVILENIAKKKAGLEKQLSA